MIYRVVSPFSHTFHTVTFHTWLFCVKGVIFTIFSLVSPFTQACHLSHIIIQSVSLIVLAKDINIGYRLVLIIDKMGQKIEAEIKNDNIIWPCILINKLFNFLTKFRVLFLSAKIDT